MNAKNILFNRQKYLNGLLLDAGCAIDLNMLTRPAIKDAYQFAFAAHGAIGQLRKYTGLPYISHTVNVAALVNSVTQNRLDNVTLVSAALLHDVLEDTALTPNGLQQFFDKKIVEMVESVTNVSIAYPEMLRYDRKKMDREALIGKGYGTHTLKLADTIDNMLTVVDFDALYAKTSVVEAQALVDILSGGDSRLRSVAGSLIEDNLARLHDMRLKPKTVF